MFSFVLSIVCVQVYSGMETAFIQLLLVLDKKHDPMYFLQINVSKQAKNKLIKTLHRHQENLNL